MDTAWSVMWNVTDETPANSERFLDRNGMEVSGHHYQAFGPLITFYRFFFNAKRPSPTCQTSWGTWWAFLATLQRFLLHSVWHSALVLWNICMTLILYGTEMTTMYPRQVQMCRRRLMCAAFIEEFSFLLDSGKDGIEVKIKSKALILQLGSFEWCVSRCHTMLPECSPT